MATVDLPSIRNMRVFLETLQRLNVPTDRVTVVLNKVEDDMGISVEEVNEALYEKVVSVLPYAREVIRSINQGQPVMAAESRSEISRKLASGMQLRLGLSSIPTEFESATADAKAGPLATARRLFKSVGRKEESK